MADDVTDSAARCACESGPGTSRRCAGESTGDDGLCDYCRTNDWCAEWRAEQEAKSG